MGYTEARGWCTDCDCWVLSRSSTPNHILHLLLSIVTCGIWLVVWLIVSMGTHPYLCAQCGSQVWDGPPDD